MGTYVKDGNSCIGCGSLLDFPDNCYNCKNLKSNIEIIKVIKDQKLKSSNNKYETALQVRKEFIQYINDNGYIKNYDDWVTDRLNQQG